MDIPFLGTNWRSTLGGLLIAAGTGLQYAGQPEIGSLLLGIGGLLLGKSAADKQVTKEAVAEVKQDVANVKLDVRDVKQDVRDAVPPAPRHKPR